MYNAIRTGTAQTASEITANSCPGTVVLGTSVCFRKKSYWYILFYEDQWSRFFQDKWVNLKTSRPS